VSPVRLTWWDTGDESERFCKRPPLSPLDAIGACWLNQMWASGPVAVAPASLVTIATPRSDRHSIQKTTAPESALQIRLERRRRNHLSTAWSRFSVKCGACSETMERAELSTCSSCRACPTVSPIRLARLLLATPETDGEHWNLGSATIQDV
jgi:hypothetical protein